MVFIGFRHFTLARNNVRLSTRFHTVCLFVTLSFFFSLGVLFRAENRSDHCTGHNNRSTRERGSVNQRAHSVSGDNDKWAFKGVIIDGFVGPGCVVCCCVNCGVATDGGWFWCNHQWSASAPRSHPQSTHLPPDHHHHHGV